MDDHDGIHEAVVVFDDGDGEPAAYVSGPQEESGNARTYLRIGREGERIVSETAFQEAREKMYRNNGTTLRDLCTVGAVRKYLQEMLAAA